MRRTPRAAALVARARRAWSRGFGAALLAAALSSAACGGAPAATDPAARAQALVESGNEAYRTGDYRLAAHRYAAAAVLKQDDPAAYYGMGMALSKLGRDEDARRAYARARELSQTKKP